MSTSLADLRELLLSEGGLIATLVGDLDGANGAAPAGAGGADAGAGRAREVWSPAALAAAGPRAEGRREEYELLVDAIYEGYLLHYGQPRVVRAREADVGVLAGDRLYAIGLERLVALGDADAVAELADTIMLSALAQGSGEVELAQAIWDAGARAVGWGTSAEHARAKTLVLEGSGEALEAMRTSARPLPGTR
ncbi:MAG TPA: hypothetical protein VH115_01840 [Solirubrobacteraceae bacterium]|nr:hypothetical protein [Solirubrobacteraceae bacterium]